MSRYADGCKCGKRLFLVGEPELCFWCGRGPVQLVRRGRGSRLRRLPRDLGAFVREGRRPDPNLDNVVRLDRLRNARRTTMPAEQINHLGKDLTRTEMRVLRLVAEGLSNKHVAERLVVSEQTVKFHMTHLMAKLGVDSRLLAARWYWVNVESREEQRAA